MMLKTKKLVLRALVLAILIVLSFAYYQAKWSSILDNSPKSQQIYNNRRVLVIAPHPDDEALGCAGIIYQTLQQDKKIKVVIMTNGDSFGRAATVNFPLAKSRTERYLSLGKARQEESIQGLKRLGLTEKDIIFLNYPDKGMSSMWSKNWDQNHPYFNGNTKLDHPAKDLRNYKENSLYTGLNVVQDLDKIITSYQPTDIYYPHPNDLHADHWATNCFVKYILTKNELKVREHLYLVHWRIWPTIWVVKNRNKLSPPKILTKTGTEWTEVPLTPNETHLKKSAILAYKTQIKVMGHLLLSFARANELFGSYPNLTLPKKNSQLLISDPVGDGWDHNFNASGDIGGIYGNITEDKLNLLLTTKANISPKITYYLHLRFIGEKKGIYPVDFLIKNGKINLLPLTEKSLTNINGLDLLIKKNEIHLGLPLSSLPAFSHLYLNGETRKTKTLIDKTAWRMLDIK